ncbi:ABC transporter ATP-binding protein [Microvirga sp. VF16]|uniref:ABC transporter ATP-binding protein n=1 Tax=Microvirga sp. VF16 TaxID=2807101 RepID=UPI00193DB833|nr:sn-glycerol-3-phosphate ABC transporter ATP-binding protein UgpC [Microvirga sp. VF16]QRM33789.1 sn-glycerol-3-phosphate ABC transporter ATP-binding protein UgpC [Microvirga sp. VF16]
MGRLTLSGLKKVYNGKQVLHGINAEISNGQFVVIVGPSGCGKSTLLRMIAGLEDITEGEIALDGRLLNDLEPADRDCAMVFQNYALYPHMTVRQNIAYPLKIAGVAKEERNRRAAEVAAILDLSPYLDRRPAELSGGQRQRVAMGRAIVREPGVFLFDEPLSNLDAKLRVSMRIEIKRLHKRLGATSIFVTHDQVEAMTMADVLIVMNSGVVEQIGSPGEIYNEPSSTFVAGFMGAPAMNLMPSTLRRGRAVLDAAPEAVLELPFAQLADGQALTLGIRPEDIVASLAPASSGLLAMVELVEELGGNRVAYCSLAEQQLAVVLPKSFEVRNGGVLYLTFPEDALHGFDATSGKRLAKSAIEQLGLVPA